MKKYLLSLLVLAGVHAHADWQAFAKAEDGDWYVDAQTIKNGARPRIWTLFDHHKPVGDFGVLSSKALHEFDCEQQRMREINILVYNDHMARGSMLRNTSPSTQMMHPPPGSVFEQLMKLACKP
jgi:hypothetical protein